MQFSHQIKYIKSVDCGENDPRNKWEITIINLKDLQEVKQTYDAVFVCNGRYSKPKFPRNIIDLRNTFNGKIIHSHDYRDNKSYLNKNAMVIGAGPSGIDISLEISEVANKVMLCHQLPQNFVDLHTNILQVNSTINTTKGSTVLMKDGSQFTDIDVIVFATGYHYDFESLDPNCDIQVTEEGRVKGVYLHYININHPTMAIWAIPQKILPFPIYHQQVLKLNKTHL